MNTSRTNSNSKTNFPAQVGNLKDGIKNFSIAGISLPEIAILGAAGYVAWRNREKIATFLEDKGIEVPSVLSKDLSDLVQAGIGLIGSQGGMDAAEEEVAPTRGAKKRKDFHDA